MKIKSITAAGLLLSTGLCSCYSDINLDSYDTETGLITLNSLISPDSIITLTATKPYFYSKDNINRKEIIDTLDIALSINGIERGRLLYNPKKKRYESDIKPKSGDLIEYKTIFERREIRATDIIPKKVMIEDVDFSKKTFTRDDGARFVHVIYNITFSDPSDEDNYYFLNIIDSSQEGKRKSISGSLVFKQEYVFLQLADQLKAVLPGWTPQHYNGLPFSDRGINGKTHTLTVIEETYENLFHPTSSDEFRTIELSAISKAYYDFYIGFLAQQNTQTPFEGGVINLGVAEPTKLYSNIENGTGILGSFNKTSSRIQIHKQTEKPNYPWH